MYVSIFMCPGKIRFLFVLGYRICLRRFIVVVFGKITENVLQMQQIIHTYIYKHSYAVQLQIMQMI
jgi:hypothetical protein